MKSTKHLYWQVYRTGTEDESLARCNKCGFTIMVGKAPASPAVVSCWCGDTEIPFEDLSSLEEMLAVKSRPPAPEEHEHVEVFAERWNSTPPRQNVAESDQDRAS
jgi:hypothetical protein